MERIRIERAVLHILDSNMEIPVLSVRELELEAVVGDFLEKHLTKILADGDLKKAYFQEENNEVYTLCSRLKDEAAAFVEISSQLTAKLFGIMKQNPEIPSGDLIFVIFEADETRYLAMIKFNYRTSYIHFVADFGEGNVNSLVKQKTTLPGETQKADECVIINLTSMDMQIIEKQYEVCGEKEFYLSKYFLLCQSDLSYKQKIKILNTTASKVSKKYLDEDFEKVAQLKKCLAETLEEARDIKVEKIAEQVFGEKEYMKQEYIEEVRKSGLVDNSVSLEGTTAVNKLRTQKLKTASGIEINFPSHFYGNTEIMEFINNPDGSISILIKNVGKVTNK